MQRYALVAVGNQNNNTKYLVQKHILRKVMKCTQKSIMVHWDRSPSNHEFPLKELGNRNCWRLSQFWMRNGWSQTQAHHGRRNLCVIVHDVIILPGQFRPLSLMSIKTFFHETLTTAKEFLSMQKEVEWSPKYCL